MKKGTKKEKKVEEVVEKTVDHNFEVFEISKIYTPKPIRTKLFKGKLYIQNQLVIPSVILNRNLNRLNLKQIIDIVQKQFTKPSLKLVRTHKNPLVLNKLQIQKFLYHLSMNYGPKQEYELDKLKQ